MAYSAAALVLWGYALWKNVDWQPPSARIWRAHVISAVLFLLVNAVGLFGIQLTLASRAGIFIFTYPLFVAIFASFGRRGERLHWLAGVGMVLAFLGVLAVLSDRIEGSGASLLGDGLILTSAALLGLMIVHVRNVSRETSAKQVILWQMTLSLPGFLLLALCLEPVPLSCPPRTLIALGYQALAINVLGFLGRAMLLERYNANSVSSFFFLTPALAVIFSTLLLGDPLTLNMVLGGVGVGLSVLLVYRANEHRLAAS